MIVKRGSKYAVVSHTTGKVLATYDTMEEAKKDLQRRHAFKNKKKY